MASSLDIVVTAVATKLMATDSYNAAEVLQDVLSDLVTAFEVDHCFLR